jgi:hypothetical protein
MYVLTLKCAKTQLAEPKTPKKQAEHVENVLDSTL